MSVTDEQVEAAIEALDGEEAEKACLLVGITRIERDEALAEAVTKLGGSAAEDRKARALLDPRVKELNRALVHAQSVERRINVNHAKGDLIGKVFQTQSANQRRTVV